ncbi:sensor domain-containing protein [Acidobacteriota bacterium]
MAEKVNEFLDQLKTELKGSDPALVQDALSDAEEHLRTALEMELTNSPGLSEENALRSILEKYGKPHEIAEAYKELDARIPHSFAPLREPDSRPFLIRFFSVFSDPRAWGACLFMLISGLTGIVFGIWSIIGGMFALLMLMFIFGLPLTGLYLLSIRGIGLIEGRIVEAFLGVRMPRKPLFVNNDQSWSDKFKSLVTESHTWKSFLYFVLMFPLGLIYCLLILLLFFTSLSFILSPLMELVFHLPLELFGYEAYTPVWFLPVVVIVGIVLLPSTLHLAKLIGRTHGRFAKSILVRG